MIKLGIRQYQIISIYEQAESLHGEFHRNLADYYITVNDCVMYRYIDV